MYELFIICFVIGILLVVAGAILSIVWNEGGGFIVVCGLFFIGIAVGVFVIILIKEFGSTIVEIFGWK